MEHPELYSKTVDILVQSYFNDTLIHGNCMACAVGNIVAANMGYSFVKTRNPIIQHRMYWKETGNLYAEHAIGSTWFDAISCGNVEEELLVGDALIQANSTGYTPQQLADIELAFEGKAFSGGDNMFNGLMAVIEALDQIHENTDTQLTQETKLKFNKSLTPCHT